ncbi:hypothetical protein ABCR94_04575 [Streptomyces sp. 21So2-11]|uniref:hypothetical protein n=1 Tax=Streptomyces sp. 21So2-11 TaxID=3144408 RepID=UPI003219DF02
MCEVFALVLDFDFQHLIDVLRTNDESVSPVRPVVDCPLVLCVLRPEGELAKGSPVAGTLLLHLCQPCFEGGRYNFSTNLVEDLGTDAQLLVDDLFDGRLSARADAFSDFEIE